MRIYPVSLTLDHANNGITYDNGEDPGYIIIINWTIVMADK